jgi:hypothetical protein
MESGSDKTRHPLIKQHQEPLAQGREGTMIVEVPANVLESLLASINGLSEEVKQLSGRVDNISG